MIIRQLMAILGRIPPDHVTNVEHINVDEQGVWIDVGPSPYKITAESDYDGSGRGDIADAAFHHDEPVADKPKRVRKPKDTSPVVDEPGPCEL